MGKGGYLGGSTILYFKPTKKNIQQNHDPLETKLIECKVCGGKFPRIDYFYHLEKEHNLKGCISCGFPYKFTGNYSHKCEKCGKYILLKIRNKTHVKNKQKKRSAKRVKSTPQKRQIISKQKTKKAPSFGTSIGDVLKEALSKKIKITK